MTNDKTKNLERKYQYASKQLDRLQKREAITIRKLEKIQASDYENKKLIKTTKQDIKKLKIQVRFSKRNIKEQKTEGVISYTDFIKTKTREVTKYVKTRKTYYIKIMFQANYRIRYRNKIKSGKVRSFSNEFALNDGQELRREALQYHKGEAFDTAITIITIGKNHLHLPYRYKPKIWALFRSGILTFSNVKWYKLPMKNR